MTRRACFKNVLKNRLSPTTDWYIDVLYFFISFQYFFLRSLCVCMRVSVCMFVNGNRVPFFYTLFFRLAWPLSSLALAISKRLYSFCHRYFFTVHVFIFYCKIFFGTR